MFRPESLTHPDLEKYNIIFINFLFTQGQLVGLDFCFNLSYQHAYKPTDSPEVEAFINLVSSSGIRKASDSVNVATIEIRSSQRALEICRKLYKVWPQIFTPVVRERFAALSKQELFSTPAADAATSPGLGLGAGPAR